MNENLILHMNWRNVWKGLTLAALVSVPASLWAAYDFDSDLTPTPQEERATRLVPRLIAKNHYVQTRLDDKMSESILDNYLDVLDPNRMFFIQADIKRFDRYRHRLDDAINAADLDPAFSIYKVYRTRVKERSHHAVKLLDRKVDFTTDEDFTFDRTKGPWATNRQALDEVWRKRVKNDILNLRLAGKENEDESHETLKKRYEQIWTRVEKLESADVHQFFMNAYTAAIEPHTSFFTPRDAENFEIRMSLSLEGIGAVLYTDADYTVVRNLIPGGPAEKGGVLNAEDRITAVGEGPNGEMVDVIGWRLADVVDLIRGPKGTEVRLQILPKDRGPSGPFKNLLIKRDKVALEEQAAKKSIQEIKDGKTIHKIGIVNIPSFYIDFSARARGELDFRSTTRDVKTIVQSLEREGVDGIIIDLRGNGGGSFVEANSLTGLFIDQGPVVQVRYGHGNIDIHSDPEPGTAYDGPLVVLVDRFSASASEIFAGAIQDYGRGLIIGEPTYGKGTVQKIINLDAPSPFGGDESLGNVKTTIAQFFRVNGDSTQHRGVIPDIIFPTAVDIEDQGERALPNALPWDHIPEAKHSHYSIPKNAVDMARVAHAARVAVDPGFKYLNDAIAEAQANREKKTISLLESRRLKEHADQDKLRLARENRLRVAKGLQPLKDISELADEVEDPDAVTADDQSKKDKEDVLGDPLLVETAHILSDIVGNERMAASAAVSAP